MINCRTALEMETALLVVWEIWLLTLFCFVFQFLYSKNKIQPMFC